LAEGFVPLGQTRSVAPCGLKKKPLASVHPTDFYNKVSELEDNLVKNREPSRTHRVRATVAGAEAAVGTGERRGVAMNSMR